MLCCGAQCNLCQAPAAVERDPAPLGDPAALAVSLPTPAPNVEGTAADLPTPPVITAKANPPIAAKSIPIQAPTTAAATAVAPLAKGTAADPPTPALMTAKANPPTAAKSWAAVATAPTNATPQTAPVIPAPRPSPAPTQCWKKYHCQDGIRCTLGHTQDQKAFFNRNDGACPRNYKMKLCTLGRQCNHHARPDWCWFAHGEQDFLCTVCGKTGHIWRNCSSSRPGPRR